MTTGQFPLVRTEADDEIARLTVERDIARDERAKLWDDLATVEQEARQQAARNERLEVELAEAVSAVQRLSEGQPFNAVVIADGIKRGVSAALKAQSEPTCHCPVGTKASEFHVPDCPVAQSEPDGVIYEWDLGYCIVRSLDHDESDGEPTSVVPYYTHTAPAGKDAELIKLRAIVAHDAYAMTFQTLAQYRTELIRAIDAAIAKEGE